MIFPVPLSFLAHEDPRVHVVDPNANSDSCSMSLVAGRRDMVYTCFASDAGVSGRRWAGGTEGDGAQEKKRPVRDEGKKDQG